MIRLSSYNKTKNRSIIGRNFIKWRTHDKYISKNKAIHLGCKVIIFDVAIGTMVFYDTHKAVVQMNQEMLIYTIWL